MPIQKLPELVVPRMQNVTGYNPNEVAAFLPVSHALTQQGREALVSGECLRFALATFAGREIWLIVEEVKSVKGPRRVILSGAPSLLRVFQERLARLGLRFANDERNLAEMPGSELPSSIVQNADRLASAVGGVIRTLRGDTTIRPYNEFTLHMEVSLG